MVPYQTKVHLLLDKPAATFSTQEPFSVLYVRIYTDALYSE